MDLCLESSLDYLKFTSQCAHGSVSHSFMYGFSLFVSPELSINAESWKRMN